MNSPAPARRWHSLLTDRWHTSSRVVAGILLAALVFCNVPGQRIVSLSYELGVPFSTVADLEHGWPFTFLRRHRQYDYYWATTVRDCFAIFSDHEEFRPGVLLANCLVVLLTAGIGGVAWEVWRRQRTRLWQLHLRDFLAAMLVVSIGVTWYVRLRQQEALEDAILYSLADDGGPSPVSFQPGRIVWLQICVGDAFQTTFPRPFEVSFHDKQGRWLELQKLTSVRHVDVHVVATTADLSHLAKLPNLEALSIVGVYQTDGATAELPALPNLRGLYVCQPANHCRRLDRLTSLESLRIAHDFADKQALREISQLPNLRQVTLNGLPRTADLSFLASRPRLTGLDLYASDVSAESLRHIGLCTGLQELDLKAAQVDVSGMRHLAGLTKLRRLGLESVEVIDGDLAALGTLKQLRELNLMRTKVTRDLQFLAKLENLAELNLYDTRIEGRAIAPLVGLTHLRSLDLGYTDVGEEGVRHLKQMKQLRYLVISNVLVDELREALPDCEIVGH